jgi:hypothetical protein
VLRVRRLKEFYHGFLVTLDLQGKTQPVCMINGNTAEHRGPVVLLSIDQHVVYGMSHPAVVSRILSSEPQVLVATKEMGHRLFEHGMKAALGKIRIGNSPMFTQIDTFYAVKQEFKPFGLSINGTEAPVLTVRLELDVTYNFTLAANKSTAPQALYELDSIREDSELRIPLAKPE